jgi:hypothetical protein
MPHKAIRAGEPLRNTAWCVILLSLFMMCKPIPSTVHRPAGPWL